MNGAKKVGLLLAVAFGISGCSTYMTEAMLHGMGHAFYEEDLHVQYADHNAPHGSHSGAYAAYPRHYYGGRRAHGSDSYKQKKHRTHHTGHHDGAYQVDTGQHGQPTGHKGHNGYSGYGSYGPHDQDTVKKKRHGKTKYGKTKHDKSGHKKHGKNKTPKAQKTQDSHAAKRDKEKHQD